MAKKQNKEIQEKKKPSVLKKLARYTVAGLGGGVGSTLGAIGGGIAGGAATLGNPYGIYTGALAGSTLGGGYGAVKTDRIYTKGTNYNNNMQLISNFALNDYEVRNPLVKKDPKLKRGTWNRRIRKTGDVAASVGGAVGGGLAGGAIGGYLVKNAAEDFIKNPGGNTRLKMLKIASLPLLGMGGGSLAGSKAAQTVYRKSTNY